MTVVRKYKKWHITILLGGVVLLVAFRLLLPFYAKKIINQQLTEGIHPYQGSVEDIDILLLTGTYTLKDFTIVKKNLDQTEPFMQIPHTDLSIEWRSLFRGHIVGEVELKRPQFNFVFAEEYTQTGTETDWVEVVKDLMPIQINRFTIEEGEIKTTFVRKEIAMASEFQQLQLQITNIRNIVDKQVALPSRIHATALSPTYSGKFEFTARANLLKAILDMDCDAQFENIELTSLNPLFKYSTNMDFESGTLDLYSEMVILNGELEGYVKPVFTNAMIYRGKEKDRGIFTGIKEFFAEGVQEIVENQKLETSATKIPVTGSLKDVQTDFWPTVIGLLRNAYWKAILKKIDESIEFHPGKREKKKPRSSENEGAVG